MSHQQERGIAPIWIVLSIIPITSARSAPKSKTLPAPTLSKTTISNPANYATNTESSLC